MWSKARNYIMLVVIVVGSIYYFGFADKQHVPVANPLPVTPSVKPPEQPILFQPVFLWADDKETRQGTGFLVKAPNGKIAGITSAHFIKFDGQPLKKAAWADVRTKKHAVRFSKCFGLPGDGGSATIFKTDLRSDYLILLADSKVPENLLLQLDERDSPVVGERVILPNKDSTQPLGFQIMGGQVSQTTSGHLVVELDVPVNMQSQSGSPVLSLNTGKVIGTLSRSTGKETKTLHLTPSSALLVALKNATEFPELDKAIGKTK